MFIVPRWLLSCALALDGWASMEDRAMKKIKKSESKLGLVLKWLRVANAVMRFADLVMSFWNMTNIYIDPQHHDSKVALSLRVQAA
jgi:hypothetical protein